MTAIRPQPIDLKRVQQRFVRGRKDPLGVVWFGLGSFWGHMRHFLASAIATEDVDSRDWMNPDEPGELCFRVARQLGATGRTPTLLEALERDVWVDYVADTGDDFEVSAQVARLIFQEYELPDPDAPEQVLHAPRGDILIFGGDTAYPVATVDELNNRVLVPYNQCLQERGDGVPRVLLGIPGNHDWYDGLDGFARLFRRPFEGEGAGEVSLVPVFSNPLAHAAQWTRKFLQGGQLQKPKRLLLDGYTAVQNASYFILPLSPDLHLCAVDRQLKSVDHRQRKFVSGWQRAHARSTPWVIAPDPAYGFCEARPTGQELVNALDLHYGEWNSFVLTGDLHHYQRFTVGKTLNVIAGGGGAFLHNAALQYATPQLDGGEVQRQWPSVAQCRSLLWQVPWKIASGAAGFIPHLLIACVFSPVVLFHLFPYNRELGLSLGWGVLVCVFWPLLALVGGVREKPKVAWPALGASLLLTSLAPIAYLLASRPLHDFLPRGPRSVLALLICSFAGSFIFGAYLALLTRLGLQHTQAFTALGHPGFKHFLRLRIRKDGRHIDGWCIGLTDPLAPGQEPQLVDQFSWRVQT
ncbi:MAG TPA: hypothetical protein VL137_01870 [Polyangiaceae bacterium]|nr:hypothetical protein [Polyangiaceae bacterium]